MISNQEVTKILADWSFWDKKPADYLKRDIKLPTQLSDDLALIIQGVRHCGKSTLLTQLPKHYELAITDCYYCNFEDPRLISHLDHNLLTKIVEIATQKTSSDKPCYFFFDEIQNVQGWEKWLHAQLERPQQRYFVVTGSNSCLLSGKFATSLTGRHIILQLFPFSYSEYVRFSKNKDIETYLKIGGFPRALTYDPPHRLLQEYFNDIVLRDVIKQARARSPESVKEVAKIAFESCGAQLSYRKIAAVTGLTVETVKLYLEACEDAYLLFACPYFAYSEKKQLTRQKKYYPIDSGIRNAVINPSGQDLGKSLELLVYIQLRQRFDKVCYWYEQDKGEIDFIVVQNKKIIPYQVTWNHIEPRHEQSLEYFYQQFPYAEEAVFITKDNANIFL